MKYTVYLTVCGKRKYAGAFSQHEAAKNFSDGVCATLSLLGLSVSYQVEIAIEDPQPYSLPGG